MKKKLFTLYLVIAVTHGVTSQTLNNQNKFKNFEIIFNKTPVIFNETLFQNSIKSKARDFLGMTKKEILNEKDTISKKEAQKLNQLTIYAEQLLLKELESEYKQSNKTFHLKVNNYFAVHYEKINDKVIGDYYVINNKSNTAYSLAKIDSTTTFLKKKVSDININWKEEVKEFREDKKIINGFKCFKIEFYKIEVLSNKVENKTKYVSFVTDEFKVNNHPFFKHDLILQKYYPLYIEEYHDGIEGAKIIYSINKLVFD